MIVPLEDHENAGPAKPVITLVFTDVVGSSAAKRASQLGLDTNARDRAYLDRIQAKYLRLIRDAVGEYDGEEIMTIGDSFFLTFKDPIHAIRCSATIQQRLYAQPIDTPSGPLHMRIGIHVGTPEYFENSWHGTDVDIAARAQSVGSSGQIVVTEAARQAMDDLPDITLRPLGTFALRGVGNIKLWDADYDRHKLRRAAIISIEQQRRRRVVANLAFAIAGIALVSGAGWRWRQDRVAAALASAAKQSIIMGDFENETGDPVFDNSLTEGFTAQLEQSPVLRLVSQQHLRQSMKYLGKSPDDPITPEVLREIGIREGVKAYLTGVIAKLGDDYIVSASAKDISTGDDIVSEEAQARDKDHVLDALDKVATAMRHNLGESLSSIQKLDTPLGQATTPSLEAFRAYALGDVEHEKGHDLPQAEGYYRQAVEIDPNFAMAWARLGVIAFNEGQDAGALQYLTKAHQLSRNVSEREKLYIDGHYYLNGLGDLPDAISTLELATRTYPLDFSNYVNLGIAYGNAGQMEQYLSEFQKAAKADPHAAVAQDDILGAQLTLDKVKDAEATTANIQRLGLDSGTTYFLRDVFLLDYLKGDRSAMRQALARAEGRPDEFGMTSLLALTQEFDGRYRDAQSSWQQAREQAAPLKAKDVNAALLLYSVANQAVMGKCEDVPKQVRAALALDKSQPTLAQAAFIASLCDNRDTALPLIADLARRYPSDTLINQVTIPQSRAALALAAHKPAEALQDLEESQPFDLISPGAYLRGLAYMELRDGARAAQAFHAATQYRGASLAGFLSCQYYALAHLGLARAYVTAGDKTRARTAYEEFFATWKIADPDIPQLMAAKKEFASLQ